MREPYKRNAQVAVEDDRRQHIGREDADAPGRRQRVPVRDACLEEERRRSDREEDPGSTGEPAAVLEVRGIDHQRQPGQKSERFPNPALVREGK